MYELFLDSPIMIYIQAKKARNNVSFFVVYKYPTKNFIFYLILVLKIIIIYVILNTSFSLALQYNIYTQKKTRNNVSFFVFILLYH